MFRNIENYTLLNMKKINAKSFARSFALLFVSLCATTANAQLTINTGVTNAQLVAGFIGNGITISNITRNCPSGAYGTFSNGGSTNLGITNGSVFTTGSASGVDGFNNSDSYGYINGTTFSDPNLIAIEPSATRDPCILTFNIVPSCTTLTIKFVFGSEEYPEFVNTSFNDAFGFFVSGPNPAGGTYNAYNVARLPNAAKTPVAVNNINRGYYSFCTTNQTGCTNCTYYKNNCGGTTIQYDGLTTVVTSNLNVTPCATYTFKIAIADATDHKYDSGVFIQQLYCSSAVQMTTSSTATCPSCTGTATVNASNGQPPYTYNWSNGQTTATATGLCSGTYSVTVSDKTNCILNSNSAVVTVGSLTPGTASIQSSTNVGCYGGSTGSATATISGGTSPYTYVWSNGQTANTATGLPSGNYTVTVIDANKCSSSQTVAITQPAAALSSSVAVTNVACSGNPASASISAAGGTPAYSYLWSNGRTTATVTGLANGNYTVTTTDVRGCTSQKTFNINITSTPTVSASSTQAGCTVGNGTASASISGGTGSPSYLWSPGGQTTATATGLSTGTYTVTVTSSGCSSNTSVTISPTANPAVTASTTNTGCTVANGTATANPSGGTGAHTYLWSPTGQTTAIATGLFAGVYTIKITDANGCTASNTATVVAAGGPTASTTVNSNVSCYAGNDGSATVNPAGGTPNYTYSWDNGATTQTITGLPAGTYVATVTDANGCVYSAAAVIVTQPTQSLTTTTAQQTAVSCFGGNDGIATANPSGGTPNYTYVWNNGQSTQTVTGLSAGTYTVNITDALGCITSNSVTITQPSNALSNSISAQTNVSCFGGNDGTATASPSGGTPSYTYLWSNGQSTQTATGLNVGTYTLTVTDAKGCVTTSLVPITQPVAALTSSIFSQTNVFCFGGNNGNATINASGGTANYSYLWENGQTTATVTGLSAGTYTVDITDALGCTASNSVTITQPAAGLNNSMFPQISVSCYGGNDGAATANPSGGTAAYTFLWSNGQTTQTASSLTAGQYSVTITDAQGCTKIDTVNIQQPGIFLGASTGTQTNISCNGGADGAVIVYPTGGTPPYAYLWSTGATTQNITGLSQGTYSVLVTDTNGCDTTTMVTITQPTGVTIALAGGDSICPGKISVLNASSTGGTPGYSYTWEPGSFNGASISVSPSTSTTYSVIATDANGCSSATGTFTVTIMPQAIATVDTTITGSTFNPVYHFNNPNNGNTYWYWDFVGTTSNAQSTIHEFPAPGEYTVTHIANNIYGCPDTFYVEIFIPDSFFIPNIFTPSGNNKNDTWTIPNTGFKNAHLEIFDRWGIKVYESDAPTISWDGHTYSGKMLSDGTYYFIADIDMKVPPGSKPKKIKLKGPITLLSHDKK